MYVKAGPAVLKTQKIVNKYAIWWAKIIIGHMHIKLLDNL